MVVSDYQEFIDVAEQTKKICSKIEDEELSKDINELVRRICILIKKENQITRASVLTTIYGN